MLGGGPTYGINGTFGLAEKNVLFMIMYVYDFSVDYNAIDKFDILNFFFSNWVFFHDHSRIARL